MIQVVNSGVFTVAFASKGGMVNIGSKEHNWNIPENSFWRTARVQKKLRKNRAFVITTQGRKTRRMLGMAHNINVNHSGRMRDRDAQPSQFNSPVARSPRLVSECRDLRWGMLLCLGKFSMACVDLYNVD